MCMHWVSRVTVTIVSVAAVQWVFLAFAQGVLSGVSPRLDTRTFCHTPLVWYCILASKPLRGYNGSVAVSRDVRGWAGREAQ